MNFLIIFVAYILAKNGYDCWIANLRGTEHSKRHETMDTDSQEFWDFRYKNFETFFEIFHNFEMLLL